MVTLKSSAANFWIFLAYLLVLIPSIQTLHCLVIKPGHGLISERCSRLATSCRVRVENDAIVWYTSKLYDRNQLACVLRNEYGAHDRSGCVRKPSGSVRCWCYGQSNCNNPENVKKLYEAFKLGDSDVLDEVIDDIETSDTGDYEEESAATAAAAVTPSGTNPKIRVPHFKDSGTPEKSATAAATTTAMRPAVPTPQMIFEIRRTTIPTSSPIPIDSSGNSTTNRSFQKHKNHEFEVIMPVKTIKILPKTDEEIDEEKEPVDKQQQIRVQNEREVRRKELASGIETPTASILLSNAIVLLTFGYFML